MILNGVTQLPTKCPICRLELLENPAHKDVSVYCLKHGDFFIQKFNDRPSVVTFVPYPEEADVVVKLVPQIKNKVGQPGHPIRCNQTGVVYPSITEACAKLGLLRTSMSHHLSGKRPSLGGYTFSKILKPEDVNKPIEPMADVNKGIYVRCNETSKAYRSLREAAEDLLVSRSMIARQLNGEIAKVDKYYTFTKTDRKGYLAGITRPNMRPL
jgi:hypothetical protein